MDVNCNVCYNSDLIIGKCHTCEFKICAGCTIHVHQHKMHYKRHFKQVGSIHADYTCNNCKVTPIIGTRWFCFTCRQKSEYNLCDLCKRKVTHAHLLTGVRYDTEKLPVVIANDPREPLSYQGWSI
jgi:hypothetical protein